MIKRTHFRQLTKKDQESLLTHKAKLLYILEKGEVGKYALPDEEGNYSCVKVRLVD